MNNSKENVESVSQFESAMILKIYEEGSETCRNYSRLTMKVRTLSQHILAIIAGGVFTIFLKDNEDERATLFFLCGVILIIFSISLGLINWHYQTAFTAIRNCLAEIESVVDKNSIIKSIKNGPWQSHLKVRNNLKDHMASYFPFLLYAWLGCIAIYLGPEKIIFRQYISILLFIIFTFIFSLAAFRSSKKDNETVKNLK